MLSNEAEKRNIRLLLSYDGTDFSGWQQQGEMQSPGSPKGKQIRTVQGTIEKALEKLHKTPVTLTGSGRTDTGVHAAGQIANFYTSITSMEAARFIPALNSLLPHDVRVLEARETRQDFHARFDARQRTYRYYFLVSREALPWELRYAWRLGRQPDLRRLNEYARLFRGEMDCSSFAVPSDKSKSRSRYISGASFSVGQDRLIFEIGANAFLWKMVRSIVGTLIRCDEKEYEAAHVREIFNMRDNALTGPIAPPQGLFLWKIDYYRD